MSFSERVVVTLRKLVAADKDAQEAGGYGNHYVLCIKAQDPQTYSHAGSPASIVLLVFPPSPVPQRWVLGRPRYLAGNPGDDHMGPPQLVMSHYRHW